MKNAKFTMIFVFSKETGRNLGEHQKILGVSRRVLGGGGSTDGRVSERAWSVLGAASAGDPGRVMGGRGERAGGREKSWGMSWERSWRGHRGEKERGREEGGKGRGVCVCVGGGEEEGAVCVWRRRERVSETFRVGMPDVGSQTE